MSVIQIRLHFAFYWWSVLKLHKTSGLNLGLGDDLPKGGLFLPHEFLKPLMPQQRLAQYWGLMTRAVVGLSSQGLINTYSYGPKEHISKRFPGADQDGVYLEPNFSGAELFMWAVGAPTPSGHEFFSLESEEIEQVIAIPDSARAKSPQVAN